MGVRRGAASPASAAGVNGGGGEVGEEDEMRVEAWKGSDDAALLCSLQREGVAAALTFGDFLRGWPR